MRLATIRNELEQTISARDGLELLQIVSKPNIGRYASEDVGSPKSVDCEMKHFL